jgi:hypothetical protein
VFFSQFFLAAAIFPDVLSTIKDSSESWNTCPKK